MPVPIATYDATKSDDGHAVDIRPAEVDLGDETEWTEWTDMTDSRIEGDNDDVSREDGVESRQRRTSGLSRTSRSEGYGGRSVGRISEEYKRDEDDKV